MKAKSTIKRYTVNKLPAGKTDIVRLRALKDSAIRFDDETPELTPATLKKLGKSVVRLRGQRGPQKAPTKVQISLRIDRDVFEAYKATGEGYLSRMNNALRATLGTGIIGKPRSSASISKKQTGPHAEATGSRKTPKNSITRRRGT